MIKEILHAGVYIARILRPRRHRDITLQMLGEMVGYIGDSTSTGMLPICVTVSCIMDVAKILHSKLTCCITAANSHSSSPFQSTE